MGAVLPYNDCVEDGFIVREEGMRIEMDVEEE